MRKIIVLIWLLVCCAPLAHARVGGGQSYSGGGSGSGGGGGDGGGIVFAIIRLLIWLTFEHPLIGIPIDVVVIVIVIRWKNAQPQVLFAAGVRDTANLRVEPAPSLDALRRFDPNFSEIVFTDFCYSLYGRVHEARGRNDVDRYAPYLSDDARNTLRARNTPGLREVRGVVVGAFRVVGARIETMVNVTVEYEANYTDVTDRDQTSWYVVERWTFERQRDILSPPPQKAKAEHCPRCGAALSTRTDGTCEYCGVRITSGAFNWYVRALAVVRQEQRGPLLTSNVPEAGTDLPTRVQPDFRTRLAQFSATHPDFQWAQFDQRVRDTATILQNAWTARDWERVRPLETEPLFQMHRYWIDAYVQQHLRNLVDAYNIDRVDPAKLADDPFYDAITVRIFASGRDYTVDDNNNVVAGSRDQLRRWSEYWTFIRTRGTNADPSQTISCPNCGALVTVGTSGICSHCGGKLTTGTFDWVLSRIEQDESYAG